MSTTTLPINSPEERIVRLLAKNVAVSIIADMIGCTPSYISQIASENTTRISALKYDALVEASNRDDRINSLEDRSIGIVETKIKQIEDNPYMLKNPMDAVRMLSTINALKRRGANNEDNTHHTGSNTIVNIVLPMHIINKYNVATSGDVLNNDSVVIDAHNNVRVAGDQELITMPSGSLKVKTGKVNEQSNSSKKINFNFD